ncbi:MAG: DNA translocase FtsK, partial [Clostridia bacterium]|nr:DNA translocase FtsK [Clostridia bacterium]
MDRMATAKKRRGRPPKKASATATELTNRKKKPNYAAKQQITAVVMFTLAVFLLLVVFVDGKNPDGSGNLWTALHNFMFGIFGICAFVWPVALGIVAVLCAMDKLYGSVAAKVVEGCAAVVLLGATVNVFIGIPQQMGFFGYLAHCYTQGTVLAGGGLLGGIMSYPISALFGYTGACITICLLLVLFIMLATGTTLVAFLKNVFCRPAKKIGETAEQLIQTSQAKKKKDEPPFNIDIAIDEKPTIEPKEEADTVEKILEKKKKVIEKYRQLDNPESVDVEVEENISEPAAEPEIIEEPTAEEKESDFPASGVEFVAEENVYRFPPISLLADSRSPSRANIEAEKQAVAEKLVETLRDFKVETKVINITVGPAVTRYELQPSAGVKISKITNLADDIALNLATDGVRIEAPIPNKPAIGIEVPNKAVSVVGVKEIIDSPEFASAKSKVSFAVGKDIAGNPVVTDIAKMPHGLIAGATNSGKSVCINSLIISILYKATPDEVKFLMIDPKMVELGNYNGIPHLMVPVVTDPRKAAGALGWAVSEMDKRYKLFAEYKVRDLFAYNEMAEKDEEMTKMPQVVIIIDELADLMMTAPHEVEDNICRLAQKARAAG